MDAGEGALLKAFDEAGITAVFLDPEYGGFIEGPKNLALALVAFELAWVDGGAATGSLAGDLALAPIHERGTGSSGPLTSRAVADPGKTAGARRVLPDRTAPLRRRRDRPASGQGARGGVGGGQEPILQVDKRGRFITNMGFANFVTAAVDSDDERIKGSCMVILEESDPGTFDRGAPDARSWCTSSPRRATRLQLTRAGQPHHRRLHGQGRRDRPQLQPRRDHRGGVPPHARDGRPDDLGQAALGGRAGHPLPARTGSAAATSATPGTPRYELGLQQKEDVLHRLVDSLGHRRGRRVARLRGGAAVRRARPAGDGEGRGACASRASAGGMAAAESDAAVCEADALELLRLEGAAGGCARRSEAGGSALQSAA